MCRCSCLADKGFLFTCLSPRPLPLPRRLDRWHRSGRRGGAGAAGWALNSLLLSAGERRFLSSSCALVVAPSWMQQKQEPWRLCPCPGPDSGTLCPPRGLGRRMWLLLLSLLSSLCPAVPLSVRFCCCGAVGCFPSVGHAPRASGSHSPQAEGLPRCLRPKILVKSPGYL